MTWGCVKEDWQQPCSQGWWQELTSPASSSACIPTVIAVTAGAMLGGYAGIPTWLPEKEWRLHLLLPSVKRFPEKQQSLWEISGLGRGGRQIAEYALGAFLRKTLETLGSIPKGSRCLMQFSSVVHILYPGKQASKTLSSSVTLQHS